MYLKALEIQGFKSFPDKTVLSFGTDVTAIVGPNGSGKSNISDAIRWVMGEQSTRALRGGKMEDVIFGGTAKRKQLGFAEVTLVLDNSEHDFAGMEDSEVAVTRRYYRSGESEYYINRRSVRLKDVNELFMDTGLGREGYSIIGQGRIDEILSVKSADRREIFEEAAGISRFRHRKEEAQRKLERTEENLVRINDRIAELELQVEPLRLSAEKAKKFLVCRDELRSLEISLWMDQLDRIRTETIKIRTDCDAAARQKEQLQKQVDELYAAAEAVAEQMRGKELEAENIRFQMMSRQADANEVESAIAVLKNKIHNNAENREQLQRELEAQEDRAGSMEGQIAQRRERLEAIATQQKELNGQLSLRQQELEQLGKNAGTLAAELERLRHQADLETASAADAKALLSALAAAAQEVIDRDNTVRQELASGITELATVKAHHQELTQALEKAQADRDSVQNILRGYALRLDGREKKLRELAERHMNLQMEHNAARDRIKLLQEMEKVYEGYSKAVKLVMGQRERGQLRGILGPVAGLIQVDRAYTVAVETALGGAMQDIVVERQEDGKAAIQFLKQREGGRCTFLPLDAIRPSEFRDRGVEQEPGFVGMGNGLVTCDSRYAAIFSSLLGRTVIAEDMDSAIAMARKYHHRFKIVTLDGQVLNPGGSMTGGSASRTAGILSRQGELKERQAQAQQLQQKLEEAAAAREQAQRELTAAQYEMETARGQQRAHEDEILKLTAQLQHGEGDIRSREERQAALRRELEQLELRTESTQADTAAARARIEELEGSAAALRTEAEGKARGESQLREQSEALNTAIATLRSSLAALEAEELATRQALAELEGLREDMAGDRADRSGRIDKLRLESEDLQRQILDQETQLQSIKNETASQQASIQRLNEERLELEGERNRADKASRDKNNDLLGMEREVSLLEQKRTAAEMEEKQILDRLWESYELTHEAARAQRVELESTAKAQRRAGELKRTIAGLGNINIDAIDEFQRVNERYTYFTDQRDDVKGAKAGLEKVIADITGEMERIFSREFEKINAAFQVTFTELFGGGKASLELEDPNDVLTTGIEIKVQPPGKSLRTLTLLSGGEKAFVAIALYFAILKVRPTPFVVMDEIEAALDDANVRRFAQYLRQMDRKTQFIVITHRRGTMEEADVLYGVTMQEQGVTRILSIDMNEMDETLGLEE